MSIPTAIVGAGNSSAAQNVFRVTFSQALSSVPTLESWDDATFSTTIREQFTGTPGNGNIPYVSAVATTDSAPATIWKPGVVAGGAVANRLLGLTNFVNLSIAVPIAGGAVRFNIDFELAVDTSVPATNTFGVLAVRFAFAGATPSLTWQINDQVAGGTEGAPQWTSLTPGSAGNFIRPADAGANSANPIITKPTSGVASAPAVWATNT